MSIAIGPILLRFLIGASIGLCSSTLLTMRTYSDIFPRLRWFHVLPVLVCILYVHVGVLAPIQGATRVAGYIGLFLGISLEIIRKNALIRRYMQIHNMEIVTTQYPPGAERKVLIAMVACVVLFVVCVYGLHRQLKTVKRVGAAQLRTPVTATESTPSG